MSDALGVSSEIGRLRTVMVHRPGVEIARLTPDNKADLLFDDLLWLERAQQEHDRFAKLMVDRGVEVLYFEDLLSEAIADDAVRDDLLDHAVTPTTCGPCVSRGPGGAAAPGSHGDGGRGAGGRSARARARRLGDRPPL